MNKRNLCISASVLIAFLVFGSVLVTAKNETNPEPLDAVMQLLTDTYNAVMGVQTDTDLLELTADEIQTDINNIHTSLNDIQSDLDGLNIAVPEKIPVYISQEFTMPITSYPIYNLRIWCDNTFELKAVYVWYNDPDNEVKLQFVTFFIDDWTGTGYFYGIRVFQAPEIVSQGYELLDYFGCSMNPTIDETHRVRFDVTFDNLGLLDWDEVLHVRIIVLAPSGTNINAVLS